MDAGIDLRRVSTVIDKLGDRDHPDGYPFHSQDINANSISP